MRFDKDLLSTIKQRADIVDIVSRFLSVQKKGKNYVALCPFHDDHNPSMQISQERGTYHCFVCGNGGDVFTFVQNYEKITFEQAVRRVAELVSFDDPRLHEKRYAAPVNEDISVLYKCINELARFYVYGLSIPEGEAALAYLTGRGLSSRQITKYGLGYAIKDGQKTIDYLRQKGYSLKNIEDIGIALAKSKGTSDSNAGRIIFPLLDPHGQIVGFSARKYLKGSDEPKYINSPETKIFHKGTILYNYDKAKETCRHDGHVYLVEGFLDVYALEEAGVQSAVAIMGTALTNEQVLLLRRLNVEIRLCLDGDDAGQRAMLRIMNILEQAKLPCRLVHQPGEKRDPDEILRADGVMKLKAYLEQLVDPFPFLLDYYEYTAPLGSMTERTKLIDHCAPLLLASKAVSRLAYEDQLVRLARVTRFEKEALENYIKDWAKKKQAKEEGTGIITDRTQKQLLAPKSIQRDLKRLDLAERAVLAQMLVSRDALNYYEDNIKYFYDEIYRTIANYVSDYVASYDELDVAMIIDTIASGDHERKDAIIKEIVSITNEAEHVTYDEALLTDYKDVIDKTRKRIYEKDLVKKAFVGKSVREKARIADDYLKKTFKE